MEGERLKERGGDMGREWSIKGLLEIGGKQLQVQRALYRYLKETGLISRIEYKPLRKVMYTPLQ